MKSQAIRSFLFSTLPVLERLDVRRKKDLANAQNKTPALSLLALFREQHVLLLGRTKALHTLTQINRDQDRQIARLKLENLFLKRMRLKELARNNDGDN